MSATALAIHATGVAIGGRGLIILGRSGAGKSRLAAALMARTRRALPIRLIGDDRLLLRASGAGLVARPHPRIAGFIERRGLGIVATDFAASAPVHAVATLGEVAPPEILQNFPRLRCVIDHVTAEMVLAWWRDLPTTLGANPTAALSGAVED